MLFHMVGGKSSNNPQSKDLILQLVQRLYNIELKMS